MELKLKRNSRLILLTAVVIISLIALAGSQPIIAYTLG
jgi:hypothetical protein